LSGKRTAGGTPETHLHFYGTAQRKRRRNIPNCEACIMRRRFSRHVQDFEAALTTATALDASRPAIRPNTVTRGRPCNAKPPAVSPAA
jgi:hypothetical protein